jgi:hypothetical protein
VLYSFQAGGPCYPRAGLILDEAGNLYGTTYGNNDPSVGSVFEITP